MLTQASLFAEDYFLTSQKPLEVFQDSKGSHKLLILDVTEQQASIYDLNEKKITHDHFSVDSECLILNSDPLTYISALSPAPFSYAHPFLVSAKSSCFIDEENQHVLYLGNTIPPKDHFNFTYLSEDENQIHFLLNRRELSLIHISEPTRPY